MVKQIKLIILLGLLVFLSACTVGKSITQPNQLVTRTIQGTEITLNIKSSVNENMMIVEQLPEGIIASDFSIEPVINEDNILMWIFSEQAPIIVGGFKVSHKPVLKITYVINNDNNQITGKWGLLTSKEEGETQTIISKESKLKNINAINISGITNLNVNLTEETVKISDETENLVEFKHDFETSSIDLSKVKIEKTENSIVVNFSTQLLTGETKTLYLKNNNYDKLCVKDAAIQSETEITNSCTGEAEYDFTPCLSLKTLNLNGINCTLNENIIKIEHLTHSGIKGIVAVTPSIFSSGSGGGGSGGSGSDDTEEIIEVCKEDWICEGFGKCIEGLQTQRCFDGNNCGTNLQQPLLEKECVEEVKPEVERFEPIINEEKPDLNTEETEQYSKVNRTVSIIIIIFAIAIIIFFIKKGKN